MPRGAHHGGAAPMHWVGRAERPAPRTAGVARARRAPPDAVELQPAPPAVLNRRRPHVPPYANMRAALAGAGRRARPRAARPPACQGGRRHDRMAVSVNMCGNRIYQGTMPMPLIGMLGQDGPDYLPCAQGRDRRRAWPGRGAPGRQPTAGEGGCGGRRRLAHICRRLHAARVGASTGLCLHAPLPGRGGGDQRGRGDPGPVRRRRHLWLPRVVVRVLVVV